MALDVCVSNSLLDIRHPCSRLKGRRGSRPHHHSGNSFSDGGQVVYVDSIFSSNEKGQ